ncbi:unnamed protein product [Sphagnum troendelagicum]
MGRITAVVVLVIIALCMVASRVAAAADGSGVTVEFGTRIDIAAALSPAPSTSADSASPAIGWYTAHGWLLWMAFGLFFPGGVLISKYGQLSFPLQWFHAHRTLELLGVAAATTGLAIGLSKFDALYDSLHAKLGLAVGCLIWAQPLLGLIRPHKGHSSRAVWYVIHWVFGTSAVLLGWYNIFLGLALYIEDWPEVGTLKGLTIAFSVQVAMISFIYLLLERIPHIHAQLKLPTMAMVQPKITKHVRGMSSDYNNLATSNSPTMVQLQQQQPKITKHIRGTSADYTLV